MSMSIINRALIKIGEPVIVSREQTPYGDTLALVCDDFRKMLLSSHYWRFAIKRAVLAKLDEESGSRIFNYVYALPRDYLLMKDFGHNYKNPNLSNLIVASDERYSIEGGKLLTRYADNVEISYIADIKDENLFTPLFKEALISLIAAEAVVRIKNREDLKNLYLREFEGYIAQARNNNEIVRDLESLPDNTWVTVRDNWVGEY